MRVVPTLITCFEVTPGEDDSFVAACRCDVLYRALRADVDFRFVAVGPVGDTTPYPAHAGDYAVVHEDGRNEVEGGVVLVNPFEVPPGADDAFVAGWQRAREFFAAQRGYLGTRLHRAVSPADFRFVNVARWSSPLMFARALQSPEFLAAAGSLPFAAHPALYSPVQSTRAIIRT
jgi:heme oxygenase (mycobilin-producing)